MSSMAIAITSGRRAYGRWRDSLKPSLLTWARLIERGTVSLCGGVASGRGSPALGSPLCWRVTIREEALRGGRSWRPLCRPRPGDLGAQAGRLVKLIKLARTPRLIRRLDVEGAAVHARRLALRDQLRV